MDQPIVRWWDPMYVIDLPVSTVALAVGDFVTIESSVIVLFDDEDEDDHFIGISLGKCTTGMSGKYIPIATKCIIECDLDSATYIIGAGLYYSAKNTLKAAISGAKQIAWLFDNDGTLTRANVLIDVPNLNISGGTDKLFEGPAA